MANIHTISSTSNPRNPYAPLGRDSPSNPSQAAPPLFSFGVRGPDGTMQSISCLQAFFPNFTVKSFVFVVTVLQVLVFILTNALTLGHENKDLAFTCNLYYFGAKYTPAIVVYYHVHRFVLPIMLHAGIGHIFFNMLSQWLFGFRLENFYGVKRFIVLYIVAGIGGNMLSAAKNTESISVGASSALFGLFALQFVYLIENYNNLGPNRNIALIMMALMMLANVDLGLNKTEEGKKDKVDNSSHLGGFIVGGLVGMLFMKRESDPKFAQKQKIAVGVLALYFTAIIAYLAIMNKDGMKGQVDSWVNQCLHQNN